MAFTWQYENAAQESVGESDEFEHRGDAESWIGTAFEDLLLDGVEQVRLFEDGSEVYGPMSLRPE